MADIAGRPKVSVVLASYNHAQYIKDAVWSVFGQGIDDIELIVVDDGSTDGTRERLEKIRDPRLRLVCLDENRRYHPRNIALSMASGEYVAFQNSDDVWEHGKLKKQLDVLERDKDLSACFTDVEIIDEIGCALTGSWASGQLSTKNRSSASWLRRFFDKGNCLCISSGIVRGSMLKEAGNFNAGLIQLGDFDLWVRLAAVGGIHVINERLTKRRLVGDKNLSRPTEYSTRRTIIEMTECLGRYAEQPVLGRLREAFDDVLPEGVDSEVGLLGGLAVYAWDLAAWHVFWANGVIAGIIKDGSKREELTGIFGPGIIHDYIDKRGRIELSLM